MRIKHKEYFRKAKEVEQEWLIERALEDGNRPLPFYLRPQVERDSLLYRREKERKKKREFDTRLMELMPKVDAYGRREVVYNII